MQELADHWNIELSKLPHWGLPTPIMDMLNFIESGTIKMFWISGTNPAVSLPDLKRVRKLLKLESLFVIAQDIFMNETVALADVVLPAAMWGEKTGCYTNVDRTVHISHKAVSAPGEAKSDLDIWVDFATRMDFRDKDGNPLVHWKTAKEAFSAWRATTKGRLCDYTGLTYEKLTGGSGIQWPCNKDNPNGTERLFTEGVFPTGEEDCESYGHDLETGAQYTRAQYSIMNPNGRAILKACRYRPLDETPNNEYPFGLSTGRVVHHFHTRTKTGRSKELEAAAPHPFIQISETDAGNLNVTEGDRLLVTSRRGEIQVPAQIGNIEAGQTFIPFHYGYFDDANEGFAGAANELTLDAWDSVSKQPIFKSGAVKIEKAGEGVRRANPQKEAEESTITKTYKPSKRTTHLQDALGLYLEAVDLLQDIYEGLAQRHSKNAALRQGFRILKDIAQRNSSLLKPFEEKYNSSRHEADTQLKTLRDAIFPESRGAGAFDVLMDLHALIVYLSHEESSLTALTVAAAAMHDAEFSSNVAEASKGVERQKNWAQTNIKTRSAQTLVVPALASSGRLR